MIPIARRDWWLGIAALVAVLAFHALFPRYEARVNQEFGCVRVDRWTGYAVRGCARPVPAPKIDLTKIPDVAPVAPKIDFVPDQPVAR